MKQSRRIVATRTSAAAESNGAVNDARCVLCGERIGNDDAAEMYAPDDVMLMKGEESGGMAHAECGISAGWQVA